MSIIEQRLKDYKLQMSIYAKQHQMLLANDVLDMIEQLQDDLKDDTNKVVELLEQSKHEISLSEDDLIYYQQGIDNSIEIVKDGDVNE